jgi:hypothetical protein
VSAALAGENIEQFRPLLPVGYDAAAAAYREAASALTTADLTHHYTDGLRWFQEEFVPHLKRRLRELSGGAWDFSNYAAYAAGSDVDFISHILEASAPERPIAIYPGDWFGFRVGLSDPERARFTPDSRGHLACLCVPSVRNGHLTAPMLDFLADAETCLLNINLYPTLAAEERRDAALALAPMLPKSILSISFSRGFALTASQLGVILVHPDHPVRKRLELQWNWFTYFFNALAARAFLRLDAAAVERVDVGRRQWVNDWLTARGLPAVSSGSYYVKSFQIEGQVPAFLVPLARDGLLRLCFKPALT